MPCLLRTAGRSFPNFESLTRLHSPESTNPLDGCTTPRTTAPIDRPLRTVPSGQQRQPTHSLEVQLGEPHGLYTLCQAQKAETWRGLARDTVQFINVPVNPVRQKCQRCRVPVLQCFNLALPFERPRRKEGLVSLSSKPAHCDCVIADRRHPKLKLSRVRHRSSG